ncbi:MAG: acetolactate synthase [Phycisphaerae bacterium]|nr:acetolactate synthase [Phycisphaerae bacterium]
MTSAPVPASTGRAYASPSVTQFSVFLINKVGKLFDLVRSFEGTPCRICALSIHEASDHAVVRIVTNNAEQAKAILNRGGLPFSEREVLVVELSKGHDLGSLCMCLLAAEIQIHFVYPLLRGAETSDAIALATDDHTLAGQILRRKDFRIFGEADLG